MGPIVSWPDQSRQFCSAVCSLTISELNVNATNGIPYCWCFRNPTNHQRDVVFSPCNDFQYPFSVIFQNSFIHSTTYVTVCHSYWASTFVPGSLRTTPAEPNSRVRWTAEENMPFCELWKNQHKDEVKQNMLSKCAYIHVNLHIYIYIFIRTYN